VSNIMENTYRLKAEEVAKKLQEYYKEQEGWTLSKKTVN